MLYWCWLYWLSRLPMRVRNQPFPDPFFVWNYPTCATASCQLYDLISWCSTSKCLTCVCSIFSSKTRMCPCITEAVNDIKLAATILWCSLKSFAWNKGFAMIIVWFALCSSSLLNSLLIMTKKMEASYCLWSISCILLCKKNEGEASCMRLCQIMDLTDSWPAIVFHT